MGVSLGPSVPLKDLSPTEFSRISELLDESIELMPGERNAWLAELERSDPKSAAVLRHLFASQGECYAKEFLETPNFVAEDLASMIEADAALVGKQFGPYRVLSLLGHGGMGNVWLAERVDGLFTRRVALKLVHRSLIGRMALERLTREREILASLDHPNIARLIDAGFAEDSQPYLALEYVAGKPLTSYCDDHRLSIAERLALFRQILSAVQYAHAHLVIHRDLKPSNIMVTESGQVYLLDFGIAKLLNEGVAKETELTQIGGRALTPDYSAPEQIVGAPITTAADVYALGVMLYELLTGSRPYKLKRDSRGALEEAILQTDPVPPSRSTLSEAAAIARATTAKKLANSLDGDLDTIIVKALKKSPAERYATANAFDEDIARFLRGDVVLAQRDSVAYRALKFVRRHRFGIAAAGVLLLTLAAGLAATSYEAEIASAQRDAALQSQLRSLTQTAAARLVNADVPAAMGIILEVLPHRGAARPYTPEALSVFQRARAADAQLLAFTGHRDRVRSVAFSPDARRIVTACWDKTARVWDAATGQELARLSGHADRVWSAAFSPDGRRVVTASHDKTARIWDAATGRELMRLSGHADRVTSAAFSPDGRRVVTGSYDKTARIWDAATGQQLVLLSGHTEMVMSGAFSADGRQVVTASHDRSVRIWDAITGHQIRLLSGHTDWVLSAAFSPDGLQVLTASSDKTAGLWDAATGRQIRLLSGHTDRLWFAAFSSDGQRIVTASHDKTARIWDAATGRELLRFIGHTGEVVGAAFSPDGQRLATASYDKTVRYWDASGREILLLDGHLGPVASAAFSPDGRQVVTGSYDKTARIWDAATGRELLRLSGHTDQVVSAAFSPDGTRAVTASLDKTARIWDSATGREITALIGHTDLVETAAFSFDGRRVVTASQDKTARIWDAATGQELMVLNGHTERLESAAFSPDDRRIVTASADRTARIWDAGTGRQLVLLSGHADLVEIAAFSSDGTRVVTASDDRTARVWDAETGREVLLMNGHRDRLWYAAFSPDGTRVITASDDRTARIWDARAPALDVQIAWAEAAQFDPLSSVERFQLGLPAQTDARQWPVEATTCDHSAAAPYDPDRRAPGVTLDQIVTEIAVEACVNDRNGSHTKARSLYQHGRALTASGNFSAATRDFEAALADGYRAAHVELALLLCQPSVGMLDIPRAISLLERAWKEGVTIAAFELGSLYEHGVRHPDDVKHEYVLTHDNAQAWVWYRKGADAGEPNALARFAEREDGVASSEENAEKKNAHLLESFKYYAAAAERARSEDWAEDAWRNWRYRRASLARVLAREGMMQQVADNYDSLRQRYSPPRSILGRLASLVGMDH